MRALSCGTRNAHNSSTLILTNTHKIRWICLKNFVRLLSCVTTFNILTLRTMDTAIQRWKAEHTTTESIDPRLSLAQYDNIRDMWQSKDKATKLLGMFSSNRLVTDWEIIETNEQSRKEVVWDVFVVIVKS